MCSKKHNDTFNDEVRWTSANISRKKDDNCLNLIEKQQLLLSSAQPTVTTTHLHGFASHQSSSTEIDASDSSRKIIIKVHKFISELLLLLCPLTATKNKSIFYQLIAIYLVLNIICNNLLLSTLLPCVSADELMDAPGARGHYTPTWAVHIPGGDHIAQQVADDHGYVLLGKVRWTSANISRKKDDNCLNLIEKQQLLLSSAQPTVTISTTAHLHGFASHQSSSTEIDASDSSRKIIIKVHKFISELLLLLCPLTATKNKSIFYQLIAIYLVLNIICNNLLLSTLLPCVSADELMDAPGARGHYTPTWAVHIPGGDHIAQQVADDHGYVLLGKVRGIEIVVHYC
uniref:CSON014469 protein n=1 Tax=Culicoides sonorensis TaxID=179676 RepID=A0A336MN06_CULSO